ncbi:MAG: lipid IV(A) 3-deoxy-D-manno-octulosonic acid transferase [Rhodoferax sp.]|nr:lipid IV(A) 3-deoxy-D-manno-octulosonic acid transferase [Rhodoferax sp.]
MRQAYGLLLAAATLPLLAYLWWRGRADPRYRQRWGERFGHAGADAARAGVVVVHCGSVGEVLAARPLIEALLADARWGRPLVTCTTPTGSSQIRSSFGTRVDHVYFPLDLTRAVRRFLHLWRPRLVILLERELWPNFLHTAQGQGVPVVVANARLSEGSAAGYRRWRSIMQPAIATLRLVCCDDPTTAGRFTTLGASPQRVAVTGNLKSDLRLDPALPERLASMRGALGERPVLTAGSTHAGEDEAMIDALRQQLAQAPNTLLILVPRHPERFDAVAALLEQAGLRYVRRSADRLPDAHTQVLLGDTMGELMLWYGVADACFVGGSLIPRGGHNPLEVMALDKPLITGRHTHNFAQMIAALRAAQAVREVDDAAGVFRCFEEFRRDPGARAVQVACARQVFDAMTGATARTLALLEPFARHRAVPAAPLQSRHGATTVWVDPERFDAARAELFDAAWWQRQGASQDRSAGRGRVREVHDAAGQGYLLRHYYRGGLMARLIRDRFLARPLARSRAMAEFLLLGQLRARDLPVPQACAARHVRRGLFYSADILVALIPDATDVARLLHHDRALSTQQWQRLGRAVRQLHDAQVFHSDLNCHNLMLDAAGKAWIVDFDKCGTRAGDDWKADNLARLLRSLRKELRLDPGLHWSEADWPLFVAGYESPPQTGD